MYINYKFKLPVIIAIAKYVKLFYILYIGLNYSRETNTKTLRETNSKTLMYMRKTLKKNQLCINKLVLTQSHLKAGSKFI